MGHCTFLLVIATILIFAFAFRAYKSFTQPFVGNPDNGINLAALIAVKQTIAGHAPAAYGEMGQVYLILASYSVFGFLGLQGSIIILKAAFDTLALVLVYLFAKHLTDSRPAQIFALGVWSVSQIAVWAESFSNFTGDTFMVILMMLAAYALLESIEKRSVVWFTVTIVSLTFGMAVWSGGFYVIAVFAAVAVALVLAHFLNSIAKVIILALAALIAAWIFLSIVVTPAQLFAHSTGPFNNFVAVIAALWPTPVHFANPSLCLQNTWAYSPSRWLASVSGLSSFNYYGMEPLYHSFVYSHNLSWLELAGFSFIIFALPAIFTAWKYRPKSGAQARTLLALSILVIASLPLIATDTRWLILAYLPLAVFAAPAFAESDRSLRLVFVVALVTVGGMDVFLAQNLGQPFYATPQFESASLWLANNTPSNSVVLTDAEAGMSVGYWSNRSAYVNFTNATAWPRMVNFSAFMLAKSGNFSALKTMHPNYVLVMQGWGQDNATFDELSQSCSDTSSVLANSNLGLLSQPSDISEQGITLHPVYSSNGIIIYSVHPA